MWNALKAFVRGKCIAHRSWKKKCNEEKAQLLEEEIGKLEKTLAEQYNVLIILFSQVAFQKNLPIKIRTTLNI